MWEWVGAIFVVLALILLGVGGYLFYLSRMSPSDSTLVEGVSYATWSYVLFGLGALFLIIGVIMIVIGWRSTTPANVA